MQYSPWLGIILSQKSYPNVLWTSCLEGCSSYKADLSKVYLFHTSFSFISRFHFSLTPATLLMCSISWPFTRPTWTSMRTIAIITRIITKLVLIHCCKLECRVCTFECPKETRTFWFTVAYSIDYTLYLNAFKNKWRLYSGMVRIFMDIITNILATVFRNLFKKTKKIPYGTQLNCLSS